MRFVWKRKHLNTLSPIVHATTIEDAYESGDFKKRFRKWRFLKTCRFENASFSAWTCENASFWKRCSVWRAENRTFENVRTILIVSVLTNCHNKGKGTKTSPFSNKERKFEQAKTIRKRLSGQKYFATFSALESEDFLKRINVVGTLKICFTSANRLSMSTFRSFFKWNPASCNVQWLMFDKVPLPFSRRLKSST